VTDASHHDYPMLGPLALAERALSRAAGTSVIDGNSVRLLCDARENYPAWEAAIEAATSTINFESYIIHGDEAGRRFVELLAAKAQQGVKVRVLYDWVGALGSSSRMLWRALRAAGVEVRCFNPFRFDNPIGWTERDHRKSITIDNSVGFVTGLCVGQQWTGDPEKGREPWRDTGVEVRGPAVAAIARAFADVWSTTGPPLPADELPDGRHIPMAGDMKVRVIGSRPSTAGVYRMDQLIAAWASETLWLTDAYFVGTTSYIQAIRAAAMDGVDVRLLLPMASDVPIVGALSRASYRPLLEGGVRIFEWNGPMLHAKTAVADGKWARVGSTNLNWVSWISNWELDVVVHDENFAADMEEQYERDLENATEIVLSERNRVQSVAPRTRRRRRRGSARGSASRAAAGAMGIGNAVSAAITNHRTLGPAEARIMANVGLLLIPVAVVAWKWPRSVAVPIAVMAAWLGITLLLRAWKLRRERTK